MAAATVAALNFDDCHTLDKEWVLQTSHQDPVYQLLVAKVLAGNWHPHRAQEIECLRPFFSVRDRLSVSRGLVTYTYDQGHVHLVILEGLCHQVAANLHASHQGLDSMLRRTRQMVHWPGLEGDLQYHQSSCDVCNAHTPSQPPEPLILTPAPEYPFHQTVVYVFQLDGCSYLAYTDRLTGWVEVAQLPSSTTSNKIMSQLRLYFVRWGAPEQVSTDGRTNLVSEEMTEFFKRWGVTVHPSSAHYLQSNGRAVPLSCPCTISEGGKL
ncbi:uncharacterized protein K02A2.6-like [Portunus trituberculatus]|uniref:uncharacterized protein K02A2.6-like n=1 Tax=Portunus trituberculatus TaxID=210409 RepID=UPI001E1D0821|nr:uncharacterized protein K02A2.6-like [Portunus trituberculatus]